MAGAPPAEPEAREDRLLGKLRRIMRKGDKKSTLFAAEEAMKFYRRTLAGLEKGDQSPGTVKQRAEIHMLLGEINHILGRLDDSIQEFGTVLKMGAGLEPAVLSEAHRAIGRIESLKGNVAASRDEYEAGLEFARAAKDPEAIADGLRGLGYVQWRHGEFVAAVKQYKEALTTLGTIEAPDLRGIIYIELGNVHSETGELGAAEFYYRKALEVLEKAQDLYQMARANNNLGDLHLKRHQWPKALSFFERASDQAHRINDPHMSGWALFNMAECLARASRLKEAESACDRALEMLSRIDDKIGIASVFMVYGIVYRFRKDYVKSSKNFKYALTIIHNLAMPAIEANAMKEFGLMHLDAGTTAEGRGLLQKSIVVYEKLGAKHFADEVRQVLGQEGVVGPSGDTSAEEPPAIEEPVPVEETHVATKRAPAAPARKAAPPEPAPVPPDLDRIEQEARPSPGPQGTAAEEELEAFEDVGPNRLVVFVSKTEDRRPDRERRLRLYMELPIVASQVVVDEILFEENTQLASRLGVVSAPAAVIGRRVFQGVPTARDVALVVGRSGEGAARPPETEDDSEGVEEEAAPDLGPHGAHLVVGASRERAHTLFAEAVAKGRTGVCVLRPPITKLQRRAGLEQTKFLQVGLRKGQHLLAADDLPVLVGTVEDAVRAAPSSAILIDCLDFLLQKNDLRAVREFLQHLVESVTENDSMLLAWLSPDDVSAEQLAQIEGDLPRFE